MTSYTRVFGGDGISASRLGYYALALSADTTLVWSPQTGAVPIADQMDVTPSTTGLSVTLPDASKVSTGASVLMSNLGTDTFTVKDADGDTVTTIAAGAVKHIYLRDNSTAAGAWGVVLFGALSSALTAADVAGYGLKASAGDLVQSMPVSSVLTGHTIVATDRAKLFRNTGGAITVALTAAATLGSDFFVAYRNDGSGDVTVDPAGAETIDGASSLTLSPTESCFIVCDGSAWYTVGQGQSATFSYNSVVVSNTGSTITLSSVQYSKQYLRFEAGVGAAAVNVVFPDSFSIWYVDNVCGYTLTLKATTGSGSTVSLANNTQYIIYCDGASSNPSIKVAHTITASSVSEFPAGTVGAPSVKFAGDTDTGIYSPGADQMGIAVGGNAAMTFSTAGHSSGYAITVPAGASGAQVPRASEVQPVDATLTALAGVATAANKLIYATGADTFATTDLTAAGRALLDDADAAAQRATLSAAASGANTDITSLSAPALGSATATTQSPGDNSTKVATTAYVYAAVPAASDTVAGKVELATSAETQTGTDTDRAVTPAGLAGFSKSLATSGYCRLPGGLLLNWGEGTYSDNQAVSFSQAFTSVFQVVATAIADGNQPVMVNNRSASGFNIQHTTSSLTIGWVAIGV